MVSCVAYTALLTLGDPSSPSQFLDLCLLCATCLLVTDPLPLSSVPPFADDVLTKDAGECVICLEELLQGDTIARLPCLCIYHKRYERATRTSSALSEIPEGSCVAGGEKGRPSLLAIRSPLLWDDLSSHQGL